MQAVKRREMETKDIGTVKASSEKVILGIDPGTNIMGYGLLRVERNPSRAVMMTMGYRFSPVFFGGSIRE